MSELALLGLEPSILHDLLRENSESAQPLQTVSTERLQVDVVLPDQQGADDIARTIQESTASSSASTTTPSSHHKAHTFTHAVYELAGTFEQSIHNVGDYTADLY